MLIRLLLLSLGLSLGFAGSARAQLSCTSLNQAALMALFSDNAGPSSITPANLRSVICSLMGGMAGTATPNWKQGDIPLFGNSGLAGNTTGPFVIDGGPIPLNAVIGAKFDGVTDDTAAIQAAINNVGSGLIRLQAGTACIKTGPLVITAPSVTLVGQNRGGSNYPAATTLSTCGLDKQVLVMKGPHDLATEIKFTGSPFPYTTNDTVTLFGTGGGAGCNECTLQDITAQGGRYAINVTNAYEVYLLDVVADSSYGNAIVYITGAGGYVRKGKFDQAYPYNATAAASTTFPVPVWIASHAYVAGNFVSTGGYILQAVNNGTSSTSAPAIPSFGAISTDGSVQWGLVGATTYYGLQCDTGCGFQLDIEQTDFSADETCGLGLTNTLAGAAPHGVVINNDTFGANLYNNICAQGFFLQITNNIFGGGLVASGGTAISLFAIGDDNIVSGNIVAQGGPASGATGIFVGGNNVNVENNICSVTTCISVGAGIQHFRVIGNSCFSGFGASTNCVFVASGASDFYSIIGNDAGGSTSSVFDGGTGTHKIVLDEDSAQYGMYLNNHLRIPTPSPTITSGFGTGAIVYPDITGSCTVGVNRCLSGSDTTGRITVGAGGSGTGTVTLAQNYNAHFPNCVGNDETSGGTGIAVRIAATSSNTLVFASNGTNWNAGDNLTYVCVGN